MFLSIVLTIDLNNKKIKNKDINFWILNIKSFSIDYCKRHNIDFILLAFDNNDNLLHPHINILLDVESKNIIIEKFKYWMFNKGYVYIEETKNIEKWIVYAVRNDKEPIINI